MTFKKLFFLRPLTFAIILSTQVATSYAGESALSKFGTDDITFSYGFTRSKFFEEFTNSTTKFSANVIEPQISLGIRQKIYRTPLILDVEFYKTLPSVNETVATRNLLNTYETSVRFSEGRAYLTLPAITKFHFCAGLGIGFGQIGYTYEGAFGALPMKISHAIMPIVNFKVGDLKVDNNQLSLSFGLMNNLRQAPLNNGPHREVCYQHIFKRGDRVDHGLSVKHVMWRNPIKFDVIRDTNYQIRQTELSFAYQVRLH